MRLKKSFPLILIASVLLLSGYARSQAPSQPNQSKPQSPTSSQHAPTPNPASSVIGHEEKETGDHADRDKEKPIRIVVAPITVEKGFIDYAAPALTLTFTLALVMVGYLQVRTLKTTNRIAIHTNKIYNEQKILLRQQTILAHGPKIHVCQVVLLRHFEVNEPIEVALSLINVGNSQATLISGNFTVRVDGPDVIEWNYIQTVREIAEPYQGGHDFKFMEGKVLEAGIQTRQVSQKANSGFGYSPGQIVDLKSRKKALWALGYVFYEDKLGRKHKTAFCRRYDLATRRFRIVNDPDLEYEF